jgi:hypothetical protein
MRKVTIVWLTVLVLTGTVASVAAQPDVVGQWTSLQDLPAWMPHTHLLPNGKVMMWPGFGLGGNPRLWDPDTESLTNPASPGHNLFCSGHVFLADGRLLVLGGHLEVDVGLSVALTYDPFANTWASLPDMNEGRWYPTATTLGNGDVLVVSGDIDQTIGVNRLPQVYEVGSGTWRDLTDAQLAIDLYPMMFLAPNGKVFNAAPSAVTRHLNPVGKGAWTVEVVANRSAGNTSYGSAVMYAEGKVLVVGGGDPPTAAAEVIDLNATSPTWRTVAPMAVARRQHNATLLPDGKVLVTGGTSGPGFNNPNTPVFAAEIWDPASETWSTMASAQIHRRYHSTALLLPDGRVLTTGGDNVMQAEAYAPPYLFKGPRPQITSAPPTVSHGETIFVGTPHAGSIAQVTWIRLGSVTHAFNQNQRINHLSFSPASGGLNVVTPSSGNLAPPGHYMLFIVNSNGVPSVASFVQVVGDTTPPTVALTAPSPGTTVSETVTVSATASDNAAVAGVQFLLDGNALGAEDTTEPYSISWATTGASNGTHQLSARARDTAGNVTTSAAVEVTVSNITSDVTIAALDATATEAGATTGAFRVSRTGSTASSLTVYYSVAGTATPGTDYTALPGSVTIAAGSSVADIVVQSINDTRMEGNETVVVTLSSGPAYTIGSPSSATVTIISDERVTIAALDATATEAGATTGAFRVSRTGSTASSLTVYYSVAGTATPGTDYTALPGSVTIPAGVAAANIVVRPINDTVMEGSETVVVTLSSKPAYTIGSPSAATVTIISDERVTITAVDATATEAGATTGAFRVSRTGSTASSLTVFYSVAGTATPGTDYTALPGSVTIPAGVAAANILVQSINDIHIEGNETVVVTLSSGPTYTIGSPSAATVTVVSDERVTITAVDATATEAGATTGAFRVSRTGSTASPLTVYYSVAGTATPGTDYTALPGSVTIPAGVAAANILVKPINDTVKEGNETVVVTLSSKPAYTIGSPSSATVTIISNE